MQNGFAIPRRTFAFLVLTILVLPLAFPSGAMAARMLPNLVLKLAKGHDPEQGPYRFRCPVFGRCNHRIAGMFMTERQGVPEAWVLAAVPNEGGCATCTSRLTLEIYRKQDGKWVKYRAWRDFDENGSWGVVAPESVHLVKVDDRRMMLFLTSGFTHMGETMEYMSVFFVDDEDITPARGFCLYYDNESGVTPENGVELRKWRVRYTLGEVKGKPALIFHIKGRDKDDDNTVIYEFMGKGLRLHRESSSDIRLHVPCGECR